jgi:hypothetical protein
VELFVRARLLATASWVGGPLALYEQVLRGAWMPDDPTDEGINALKLSGIVRVAEGVLQVRNRIYRRVFDTDWVKANLRR